MQSLLTSLAPCVRVLLQVLVYIVASRTGTLYIGITGYLTRRIRQHKIESIKGLTQKYKVHRLVYYETYDHVVTAINREKQLQGMAPREEDSPPGESQSALAGYSRAMGP